MNPSDLVFDGALWVGVLIAALAGFVSFASPCVLPLVPGYFGYLGSAVAPVEPSGAQSLRLSRLAPRCAANPP